MNHKIVSFTSVVKEEIISKPFVEPRLKALLSAFCKANGRYLISNKGSRLELKSEQAKIAKFVYMTIKRLYGIDARFAYTQAARFHKSTTYHVVIEQDVETILQDLNLSFTGIFSLRQYLKNDDEVAGYLSGIFLANGSVNDPESSNYHLEMSSQDITLMSEIHELLTRQKIIHLEPKIIKRRNRLVVYIKKSDQIAEFLILLGATDATLDYESIRVARDYANSDNRWQICENANMQKTLVAAEKQRLAIQFLADLIGIDHLPTDKMQHLARLRLEDEGASLGELAARLSELIKKPVSKSNVAHLFRSIIELAERYQPREH